MAIVTSACVKSSMHMLYQIWSEVETVVTAGWRRGMHAN